MKRLLVALLLVCGPGVGVLAAETVGQQRTITRTYVSPGASGSIGESSSQQSYRGYGGVQVPDNRYDSGSSYQGSGSTEYRGNVRQSTEYPGVGEFQRQPGSRSVEREQR